MAKTNNTGTPKVATIKLKSGEKAQILKDKDRYVFINPIFTKDQMIKIITLLVFILIIVIILNIFQFAYMEQTFNKIFIELSKINQTPFY